MAILNTTGLIGRSNKFKQTKKKTNETNKCRQLSFDVAVYLSCGKQNLTDRKSAQDKIIWGIWTYKYSVANI